MLGIVITAVWSGAISYLLLKGIDKTIGLRVSAQDETEGLDVTQHDEQGYNFNV